MYKRQLLASTVDLINVPFMVLFFGIYVVYTAILSLTAFFARIHTVDLKLYPSDVLKAIGLCVVEVSCLRFVMAWVRIDVYKRQSRGLISASALCASAGKMRSSCAGAIFSLC